MSAALAFVTPPAGLAPLTRFTLNEVSGADGLYSLRAIDNSAIRLFVLDAAIYLPDYSPEISDEHCRAIDLHTADDAMVLVVANPGESGTRMNLLAPIVVNVHTGACAQVILDDQDWPLQAEFAVRSA
ncbi:flagellar assembly protein FliW [Lacisediminihabitans sp. FW035]